MTALELKAYPEGGCETAAHCELKGRGCVECVDEIDKRFSDAELAAEFQFARLDSRVRQARVNNYSGDKVLFDHYERGLEQEWVIERFATLPHYDEPQS